MKQLTCEMCGSTDLVKDGGVFVCQKCGCKYSIEEAKKMMVEGVVQVEGTVKTDRSEEVEKYLDLARTAEKGSNMSKAEEYASKVLEIDSANIEAWIIYGKSIDCQTNLAKDRFAEANSSYSKALQKVADEMGNDPQSAHEHLLELKELFFNMAEMRSRFFANAFKNSPTQTNRDLVVSSFKQQLESYAARIDTVRLGLLSLAASFPDGQESPNSKREDMLIEANDCCRKIARMYWSSSNTIACDVVSAFLEFSLKWNKHRIFTYSSNGGNDTSDEIAYFDSYTKTADRVKEIVLFSLGLLDHEYIPAFIAVNNETKKILDRISGHLHGMAEAVGASLQEAEKSSPVSVLESKKTLWKSVILIEEENISHKTNRRFFGPYSSGQIKDGIAFNDIAIKARKADLEQYKKSRDACDIKIMKKPIVQQLEERYWATHDEEADEHDLLLGQIESMQAEIAKLESEKSKLSVFKGKQRTTLNRSIDELNHKIKSLEARRRALSDAGRKYALDTVEKMSDLDVLNFLSSSPNGICITSLSKNDEKDKVIQLLKASRILNVNIGELHKYIWCIPHKRPFAIRGKDSDEFVKELKQIGVEASLLGE
ncbi:hypothetical protein DMP06_08660 [Slackia equolifaciens]|uniref:Uncharacterized protein n=1 Tax=Slackia equolifaciens TaxID=498718 RepID=A0A3N0AWR8_9ACTN|nr:hypothetical protein [Slackia equolifaciens]RNL38786.1 hypothetical protein DMP06_08660 [Slackia equolifaciens]